MRSSTHRARRASQLVATIGDATEAPGVLTGEPLNVVDLDTGDRLSARSLPVVSSQPFVRVGVRRSHVRGSAPAGLDVALTSGPVPPGAAGWVVVGNVDEAVDRLTVQVAAAPEAAVVLCQVLRAGDGLEVDSALVLESLAYSTLQSGPAFSRWLATSQQRARKHDTTDTVLVERRGPVLAITLNRPASRNALNVRMRDELTAALELARADPTVESVHLCGNGPSYCSGGDLSEFGSSPDPVTGHLVRIGRSPASLLAAISRRTTAHLHGASIGAGIELAAFCARVVATPDTWIRLPELDLGLIPGAGGTVSIRRRIGRQRTAWLALSGEAVQAPLARDWGLVDVVDESCGAPR